MASDNFARLHLTGIAGVYSQTKFDTYQTNDLKKKTYQICT